MVDLTLFGRKENQGLAKRPGNSQDLLPDLAARREIFNTGHLPPCCGKSPEKS
jgi:hypothetical protein